MFQRLKPHYNFHDKTAVFEYIIFSKVYIETKYIFKESWKK